MVAQTNVIHLADAAIQSAKQCLSTRAALRQARLDEKKEIEKEQARLEKEKVAEAKRAAQKKKRDEEKEKKREKKEHDKEEKKKKKEAEDQAEAEQGAGAGPGVKGRRRGKGADELEEGIDPPCLTNRFQSAEVPTVDDLPEFVRLCAQGVPVLWKARRPPLKRIIEEHGETTDKKALANMANVYVAEWKAFQSTLAEQASADPELRKRNKMCSPELQEHRDALSLDSQVQALLEQEIADGSSVHSDPCMVMERSLLKDYMKDFSEYATRTLGDSQRGKDIMARMKQETSTYDTLHLVGMPQTKTFSGTFGGLFPHVVYQIEGTKVCALVRAADVTCQLRD